MSEACTIGAEGVASPGGHDDGERLAARGLDRPAPAQRCHLQSLKRRLSMKFQELHKTREGRNTQRVICNQLGVLCGAISGLDRPAPA